MGESTKPTPPMPKTTIKQVPDNALLVSFTQKYGKSRYWPENHLATLFVNLLDQEALSVNNIESIKLLGYQIYCKVPGKPISEL